MRRWPFWSRDTYWPGLYSSNQSQKRASRLEYNRSVAVDIVMARRSMVDDGDGDGVGVGDGDGDGVGDGKSNGGRWSLL
jgi:hypothetical protein